jgi:Acetyltransferase (GNAT) domain
MWFPHGSDFATVGMVITSPRLQTLGIGQWLMKRIMAECQGRRLRLNATRAARHLYLSLNFRPEKTVFQCQGEARQPQELRRIPEGAELRRLEEADLGVLGELDAKRIGVPRAALVEALFQQSLGFGLFRGGRLDAFAPCRRFGRGHVVGPVVASGDDDAIAVVAPHVAAHDREFLRLDTHLTEGEFWSFLTQSGLAVSDTVLTMSAGGGLPGPNETRRGQPVTYALAGQALG